MDSLSTEVKIIGPDIAAFRDLNEEGLLHNYQDFDDLINVLDNELHNSNINIKQVSKFIEVISWANFGRNLNEWIF